MKEKLEKLKNVAYNLFLDGNLPKLNLEDYITMINALAITWGINIDFRVFFENINDMASNKYRYFSENFSNFVDKHLYGKEK